MSENHQRVPVSEDAVRSYRPEAMAGAEAIDFVLDYVTANGPVRQSEIRVAVYASLVDSFNSACARTSGALLYLREEGYVRCTRPSRGSISAIWEAV
jgi:hypothetical protein